MPISMTDSFIAEKALDYAKLSDFAYAKWGVVNGVWKLINDDSAEQNYYINLWESELSKRYEFVAYEDDNATGYQGVILRAKSENPYCQAGKMILANRGSNKEAQDYVADALVSNHIMPTEQFRSMAGFINKYIGLAHFEVTGHSLGGCLAEIAKAAYAGQVDEAYTFGALGALNFGQMYELVPNSLNDGKVTVSYAGSYYEWDAGVWEKYAAYFTNNQTAGNSKIYNVSGIDDRLARIGDPDIGAELFIAGDHSINGIMWNIYSGTFYVDPRKPVTVIGSSRDGFIYGDYDSKHYPGSPIGPVTLVGGYGTDLLKGGEGDDWLYGDLPAEFSKEDAIKTGNASVIAGSDTLTGGKGDDHLFGGPGNDIYYYNYLDGNDTIKDSEGNNTIIYKSNGKSQIIKDFYRLATGADVWRTIDDQIQISHGSSWIINLPGGGTITLEASPTSAFGIQLLDKPVPSQTSNTIYGEDNPPYFYDRLFDTAANDIIYGLKGDDDILATVGGNDWLVGGEGNDIVQIARIDDSKNILEGGSGSDLVLGGSGDDQLFGENFGEMEALVAAGEVAPNLPGRGDVLSAGPGNDFVYGGNAGDLLFGDNGSDLIVGGGGDDAILGDDNYIGADRDWSFTVDVLTDGIKTIYTLVTPHVEYTTLAVPGDDVIYAGTGNDFVNAGGGADEIYAGDGDDVVFGDAGDDFIDGGAGNDVLVGDEGNLAPEVCGNDYIDGGAGDDKIEGCAGSDTLYGGDGNDNIKGGDGDDYIEGGSGNNTLYGDAGNDTIFGGDGIDLIEGGADDDYLDGGAGDDTLVGVGGADTIFGGDGDDKLHGDSGDTALADQGDDYLDGGKGNDTLLGYNGNDELYGGDGNDTLYGDGITGTTGNDYLDGGAGDDTLYGGSGNDEIYGGDGIDILWGDDPAGNAGADYLDGGAGDDTIAGAGGADTIFGGDGDDNLHGDSADTALAVQGDDFIDGGTGNDTLVGYGGNDTLFGGEGNDQLIGEAGDDYLDGGAGDDYLQGGSGSDTYVWGKRYGNDTINNVGSLIVALDGSIIYMNGADTLVFGEGITPASLDFTRDQSSLDLVIRLWETGETLTLKDWYSFSPDRVARFQFADGTELTSADIDALGLTLRGTEGNDTLQAYYGQKMNLYGLGGNDTLRGANMNDGLYGGAGNDALFGWDGNDILSGDAGDDSLWGGKGNDTYLFGKGSGNDVITHDDPITDDFYNDTVILGEGLTQDAVEFIAGGEYHGDLVLRIKETGETLRIQEWSQGSWSRMARIAFSDGTVLTSADIAQRNIVINGTDGNDDLIGWYDQKMAICGLGGDDYLYAFNKDVIFDGGTGNDEIYGGSGNDQLFGGSGDDYIVDDGGDDIIAGGPGNDDVKGGHGSDIFRYALGDGSDVVWRDDSDILEFGSGITADSFELLGEGGNDDRALVLRFKDSGETIRLMYTVGGTLDDKTFNMQHIRFADGTEMTASDFANRVVKSTATSDSENISGFENVKNEIYALGGDDYLFGKSLNDILDGGAGNDYLMGSAGNDVLYGGDGNDYLFGDEGDDILVGGPGNDYLSGWDGIDTFRFSMGDGNDSINAVNGDILEFGTGITPASVEFINSDGSGLTVRIKETGEQLYFFYWFTSDDYKLGSMKFADGTVWTLDDIKNRMFAVYGTEGADTLNGTAGRTNSIYGLGGNDTLNGKELNDMLDGGAGSDKLYGNAGNDILYGGDGSDTLSGSTGNDILVGGPGADTLDGGTGADTYRFSRGDGADTVSTTSATNEDTLEFAAGIAPADVVLTKGSGSAMVLKINGTTDQITFGQWFTSDTYKIGSIKFADGTVWMLADIKAKPIVVAGTEAVDTLTGAAGYRNTISGLGGNDSLTGQEMEDTLDGGAGNDTLNGGTGNDALYGGDGNDTLSGSTGNDILVGGTGTDTVDGGAGADTIRFARGDGADTISTASATSEDTFDFGAGIAPADVLFTKGGETAMVLKINGTTDQITFGQWAASDTTKIGSIKFADGTVWTLADLKNRPIVVNGTEAVDTLTGLAGSKNNISGLGGNDTLTGQALDDTLDGGTGNDILNGAAGNDAMIGGAGDDTLNGGDGSDILAGGTGTDTLDGGAGADTYRFALGDGADTITVASEDTIEFGAGITPEMVEFTKVGTAMVLRIKNTTDQITFSQWSSGDAYKPGSMKFADGTVWTLADIKAKPVVITGTDSANSLSGLAGSVNMISGLGGNDTLNGQALGDTLDGGDGNDTLSGLGGDDTLLGGTGNDILYGGDGNDILSGGAGTDTLEGGAGADTYRFARGDGADTISARSDDFLVFGAGIAPDDVVFAKGSGSNLVMKISGTTDQITFNQWATSDTYKVNRVTFADGTVWSLADIKARPIVVNGTEGIDTLTGMAGGTNTIYGLGGNDTLNGKELDDILDGGAGNDILFGVAGNDTLFGGAGDDTLSGGDGNDILVGGTGNDTLDGGAGADTYRFVTGDGADTITASSEDTLEFGAGIAQASVEFTKGSDTAMILRIGTTSDQITFSQWPTGDAYKIGSIKFADGTVWSLADIKGKPVSVNGTEAADTLTGLAGGSNTISGMGGNDTLTGKELNDALYGGAGNDILNGGAGNDILVGGAGNDTLDGGAGADTLQFSLGDGADTISTASATNEDTLLFGAGITTDSVVFAKGGDTAMVLKIDGTSNQISFGQWAASDTYKIGSMKFADGTVWSLADIKNRFITINGTEAIDTLTGLAGSRNTIAGLSGNDTLNGQELDDALDGGAGNDILYGLGGNDTLTGSDGIDKLYGGDGNDILVGGAGNDTLDGGAGVDTYRYGRGDGSDTISARNDDTIEFALGITPTDLEFTKGLTTAMTLRIKGTTEQLTFSSWFTSDTYKIGSMKFADGTVWSLAEIKNRPVTLMGTEGKDMLTGFAGSANTMYGLGMMDSLTGKELDDYIDGGSGDDTIKGWRGNDTLIGGTGSDKLYGESGSDLYIFERGHGRDTLQDLNETPGSTDTVKLDGLTRNEIVFSRNGDDLLVLTSANDSILCKYNLLASYQYTSSQTGTFTDTSPGIERVETSDGYYITRADIVNIVNAMVAYNISDNMTTSAQYTNFMGNTDYQAMLAQGWHQITNP